MGRVNIDGGTSRSCACWDQFRSSQPRDACSICPARASAGCLPGWPWTPRGHCGWISCATCLRSVTFGLFGTAARSARVQAGPGSLLANPLARFAALASAPASWPRRDGSALPEPQARSVRSQAMPLVTPTCMDTHPRRAEPYRERRNSSRWFTDDHSIGSDVPRDLRRRVAYSAQALELSHVCPVRPGSGHRSSGLS